MSYGMMAFAVDFDALNSWIGSGDEALVAKLLREMGGELTELDELDLEEDDEITLPAADALRQLIMGEPLNPEQGYKYAYLIKDLCWAYDEFLDNHYWCPIRSNWVSEQFDPKLQSSGVPAEVFGVASHLLFRGSPFPIPEPECFPAVGYLTPEEVPGVADLLARIDPECMRPIEGHNQLIALQGWLTKCRETNRGLICFYH